MEQFPKKQEEVSPIYRDSKAFIEEAERNGLTKVTQAEWDAHARGHPERTLNTCMVRIKNARKGVTGPQTKTIIGYPMGGRDHTYKGCDITQSKSIFVPVLNKATGEIVELSLFQSFQGKNERLIQVEYVEKTSISKGRTYINKNIKTFTTIGDVLTPETLKKLITRYAGDLMPEENYKPVAFQGFLGDGWDKVPIWDDEGNIVDGFSLFYGNQPCFQVGLESQTGDDGLFRSVKVQFSPSKTSVKDSNLPDLHVTCQGGTLNDLIMNYTGYKCWFIGTMSRCQPSEDESGQVKGYYMTINCTAIIAQPEQPQFEGDVQAPLPEETAPKSIVKEVTPPMVVEEDTISKADLIKKTAEVITPEAPATGPSPEILAQINSIRAKVLDAKKTLGISMTADKAGADRVRGLIRVPTIEADPTNGIGDAVLINVIAWALMN